ncbi:MAG TPA: 3-hydroxyacyl-CoA dehydrogenase NAD-binding domain-containing protein [Bryobacteraceae bacterium]|jgi:3-hydroxyacyl-CoA dehydrogenase|nr:3-hydroxyacyl-CoA dehydrogenase NAD-binding domain-containing protein [Bryobacteraceae bacterium]
MADLIQLSIQDEIAVITLNNPPVNALSPGMAEGIAQAIHAANKEPSTRAIVLIGAGQTFIAGADIREFEKIVSGERPRLDLLPSLQVIEDSGKPVVAAIHGTALGGGLETALCGHYRVLAANAQVGQPEVKLGLIPGAGGTQRLPRLAGVAKALEMCVWGEPVKAAEAVALGVGDRVIEGDLLTGAIAFAHEIASRPVRKTRERNEKLQASPGLFDAAREQARKKGRGLIAPEAAIDAIEASITLPFEEGCRREAELFNKCLFSSQSKALIHAFFGERTVAKIPGITKATRTFEIHRAAIVGAGTMGGGIAMAYVNAGIPVLLKEASQEALDRGMNTIRNNYANTVAKGRLASTIAEQRLALLTPQLTYAGFEQADIIIEAVFESMSVKKQVFRELDGIAKPDCVLASNTSSLDIDEIAAAANRSEMVIGNHFFSPANVMRLLEVVRGKATAREVIATSMLLAKRLGKVAVLAANCRGFIGNRMIAPYLREAHFLVEEGASVEQVNQALYDFGMAMGPLAVDDLTGLDVSFAIRKEFEQLEKPGVRKPLVPDLLYQQGRLGQKTGRGWSKYDASRKPSPSEETAALIERTAAEAGIKRRALSSEEIVERCIYALVNEGARILEEGIALRAVDIDIIYLNGYGFPAWRGGPMFYADSVGLTQVAARLEEFRQTHGEDLWPRAPLLEHLTSHGQTFSSFDRTNEV